MARVLWRHRLLVAGGFAAAVALAFLSLVRVNVVGGGAFVQYREKEQWASYATLFVTQHGFPWGRSVISQDADPSRFGEYATLYARLASSDPVKKLMLRRGPIDDTHESINAAAILASDTNTNAPPLPLISLWAIAPRPGRAVELATRATAAFREFLQRRQQAAGIPSGDRVILAVSKRAEPAKLLRGRSKTLPVVIFLTMMIAVCGLAFVFENLRLRSRQEELEGPAAEAAPVEAVPVEVVREAVPVEAVSVEAVPVEAVQVSINRRITSDGRMNGGSRGRQRPVEAQPSSKPVKERAKRAPRGVAKAAWCQGCGAKLAKRSAKCEVCGGLATEASGAGRSA